MPVPGYSPIAPVCESGDFALYQATRTLDGQPVLLKVPAVARPEPVLLRRLEHEYKLARDIVSDRIVRPLALERRAGVVALVLEPGPDRTLASLLDSPLDIATFLRIAIGICAALADLHRHELVHKDLKPEHVLLDAAGRVWLTGLGVASRLPRERQAPEPLEVISGTLAYMAPEQTGRMNRSIDSRSDLYALGVTFYRMLTGTLPFTASDPMEWVHCHIARQPEPPSQRLPGIPEPLSAVVMKLLAKTAEERYQSTAGLDADLRHCLAQWEVDGRIAALTPGRRDIPDRLFVPERLFGRQAEIATLLGAFGRVVASGTPEIVLISGYSGIGKTAVVHELHKVLVQPRGLFAAGKFDQFKRDIPYATLVQALQTLVRQILCKSEAEVRRWRDALQQAVSPNGQLVVGLIPEVELVLGKQPPVPGLPPQEARNRFQMVLRRFLGVFADPAHPLILFLDDLQWLDAATLELIEQLVSGQEVRHLLLIGAYRDNEVGPTHPLMRVIEAIRKRGAGVREIALAPLSIDDVGSLVADSLHCERERALPMAQMVHEKTGGNPLFAIQFLTALAEEKLLAFDPGEARWIWDMARIHAKGYTDNVVDLMVGKLGRLPEATQDALKQFACLGNVARVATLTMVCGLSEDELHAALWDAARLGLVVRLEDGYAFLHDRVQEAAYALVPEDSRKALHLKIGRLLASGTAAEEIEENIFDIANQFNRGAQLIESQDEREFLASLDFRAGKRAKAATAYASALNYLAIGAALLADDSWERLYELTFALELNRAECEFLTGDLAAAEQRLAMLAGRAGNLVDHAAVTCLRLDLYTTLDKTDRAVDICHEYLRRIGVEWSAHPTWEEVQREYDRMWQLIGDRPIASLADLPSMTDPEWRGTMDVLSSEIAPATLRDGNLLCLVVARMANLSLEHGNTDGSCQAYVYLGMLLGQQFDNYPAAFQFGTLALDLMEKHGLDRFRGRVSMCFGSFVNPWARHIASGRPFVLAAFDVLSRNGDLTWAGYCGNNLVTNLLASGEPLAEVQQEAEFRLLSVQKARFGLIIDMISGQLGLIRALRGMTPALDSFSAADFDERQFMEHLEADPRLAFPAGSYWIRKLQALFLAANHAAAIDAAARAKSYLWTLPSFFEVAEYHFYSGLAHAAACASAPPTMQRGYLDALTGHLEQLAAWAENCPANFADRVALLSAEAARIGGRLLDAEHLYEEAIRAASENGFVQIEALAYELAAEFYRGRGFARFADSYLSDARACYVRWGAQGKVRQLEQRYPQLRETPQFAPTGTFSTDSRELDILAAVRASQAISGEMLLDNLLKTLMRIVLESAGARQGHLLLMRKEQLTLAAEARVEKLEVVVQLHLESGLPENLFPASILNYVRRTRDKVLIDDASGPTPYSEDEYFLRRHPQSVLCFPITKQTRLIGLLYLENDLAAHAFTPDRLAFLELLAAQAAISLENALVYRALQESEAWYRRIVDTANEGIWMLGPDAATTFVNGRLVDMLGYPAAEMVGRPVTDFMFDEDASAHLKRMEVRLRGQSENYELRLRRRTGETLWALASASPIFDDEQRFMGSFAMLTDITERKAYIRDLQCWHDIFEHAEWGVVIGGPDGKTLDMMNPAFAHMHGFAVEELTGRPIADVFAPQSREDFPAQIRIAHETGHHSFESLHVRKDGSTFPVFVDVTVVRGADGQVMHRIVNVQDITERKRAEEELRQSEEQYRTLIQKIQAAVIVHGADTRILTSNSMAQELLGLTEDQLSGKSAIDPGWHFFREDGTAATHDEYPVNRVLASRKPFRNYVFGVHRPAGHGNYAGPDDETSLSPQAGKSPVIPQAGEGAKESPREFRVNRENDVWVLVNADPVFGKDGEIAQIIVTFIDITERKRADDELTRYKERLEDTVRQRTAELLLARDAAEAANKSKSLFLAHMSHELRTPLNSILGYAQIMQRDKTLSENHANALGVIRQSGEHLLALIDDILDLARIETGRLELVERDIPLVKFLHIVAEIVGVRARQKALEFFCELAPDLPACVRGDERRLRQVLLNLLSNAIKFTDSGKVELRVTRCDTSRLLFEVEDTGIGIAESELEVIFRPFEQAGDVTRRSGGTGLGLAISRQLVRLMGGEISVESRVGKGSLFRFELELPQCGVAPHVENSSASNAAEERRFAAEPMTPPPRDELLALRELALLGNMRDILQYAGRIEGLDSRYRQFAAHLRELAASYQSKAILQLAEQYLQ